MEDSRYFKKIMRCLQDVRGKSLSVEERREAAVEMGALMLNEARRIQTNKERRIQSQLQRMMQDLKGKVLTMSISDQCFRSHDVNRVASQLHYLLKKYGVPRYLSFGKKIKLLTFKWLGKKLPKLLVPLVKRQIRKETSTVIFPGERRKLSKHLRARRRQGMRTNLNHLGEAVLGEEEAKRRLELYLDALARPEVECVSVKVSTICSQINLLAWEETVEVLVSRLKKLYRVASQHEFIRSDGKHVPKFVNLDMEEFSDLHLTVEVFKRALDDPEFHHHSAGVALQSYLPDTYLMQQSLTVWAMQRVASGGAPIRIRIVKGANLAMEKVEASLHGWTQAPYPTKADVDANFKRMVHYACIPENAAAAHIGIGSHNLFDVAYVLLLRAERGVEKYVGFEMLEGMADHVRRVVKEVAGDLLLYCPAAKKNEFQNAVAYLVRRLDENTAPENFLRNMFGLIPGTKQWQKQANLFSYACHNADAVSMKSNRSQNRLNDPEKPPLHSPFRNEPDTDWVVPNNRKWVENVLSTWSQKEHEDIPLVIGGQHLVPESEELFAEGRDPSFPEKVLYRYSLATEEHIDRALEVTKNRASLSIEERSELLAEVAHLLRLKRGDLIGAMVADTGKVVTEADVEISEAIDFAEYYRRNMQELISFQDVKWEPKGTVLIAPPWNFPCSIPMGGILAALVTGNSVIFKPAPEAVLVGWKLAKICWDAGVSQELLQFITCEDDPVGSCLVKDPRVDAVVLTGSTDTAKYLLKHRPGLDLIAETGGKNAMIITSMADRDLAIHDLLQSAFSHAGQKCSACSLAVCEAEVYDDPHFRQQLRDAAATLNVGRPWSLSTDVNPLIHEPNSTLLRGLKELDEGEEWLLEPKQDPDNPNLWSPGIKIGVKPGSFTHQNEFFGPVLALMRADNLNHAIEIVNGTRYGLTSGIHSLDEREHRRWKKLIQAGNCYINRGITGAIVQRQPFGGCKESSFGPGRKAGGPNYLLQLLHAAQVALPRDQDPPSKALKNLTKHLKKSGFSSDQQKEWEATIGSYAYAWNHQFSQGHDLSKVRGQDNIFRYVPYPKLVLRVLEHDDHLDVMRVIAAAVTCHVPLVVSADPIQIAMISKTDWFQKIPQLNIIEEAEEAFVQRVMAGEIERLRILSEPSQQIKEALAESICPVIQRPVVANGRFELPLYFREVSISYNYHRYGNLGDRQLGKRK